MVVPNDNLRERILPLDLHFFRRNEQEFAIDTRSLFVLKLSALSRVVLQQMQFEELNEIIEALSDKYSATRVTESYRSFINLIINDILSIEDVAIPKIPGLQNLVLMTAGGCNMGCTYCFEHDVPSFQSPNLLSKPKADKILNWFMENHEGQYAHIQYYGGEPLLNWDIIPYSLERLESWAAETEKFLSKYIITNGTLLTDERIDYLSAHEVDIQLSMDGGVQSNSQRVFKNGKSTHSKAADALRRLNERGARYNVRAVLQNKHPVPEDIVSEIEALDGKRISFGTVSSNLSQFRWTEEQHAEFSVKYAEHIDKRFFAAQDQAELPANVQGILRRLRNRQRIHYACHAGTTELTAAPDGSLFECQRLMGEPLGHVDDGTKFEDLNSKFLAPVDFKTPCRDCFARYLCGGGCKESNTQVTGGDQPWPAFCEAKRRDVEVAAEFLANESG